MEHTDPVLRLSPNGYTFRLAADAIDASRFEKLAEDGARALDSGDLMAASRLLRQALDLWHGPALADVDAGHSLQKQIDRLEEIRHVALNRRLEIDLHLGRHQDIMGELRVLVSEFPTDEGYCAKLMVALCRSGRRGAALTAFRDLRTTLVRELGVEPSRDVQILHQAILSGAPDVGRARRDPGKESMNLFQAHVEVW